MVIGCHRLSLIFAFLRRRKLFVENAGGIPSRFSPPDEKIIYCSKNGMGGDKGVGKGDSLNIEPRALSIWIYRLIHFPDETGF
jgi:hypothetical protein